MTKSTFPGAAWQHTATPAALRAVVNEVRNWVTTVPVDLATFKLHENTVDYAEGEHAAITGPMPPRGPATGLVIRNGLVEADWGDPDRPDIAFSVSKGALSTLTGLALADGLVGSLDERVGARIDHDAFKGPFNEDVTWRHLLTLTSEWRGSLWGIPDSIDWHRTVPKKPDDPPKGSPRQRRSPGELWEFNDVRVNVLALALTLLFREALPAVFKRRIMDPIGASAAWNWGGLKGAEIEIAGKTTPVVTGGAHWGGGLVISAFDLARLALLYARRGTWGDRQILPEDWFDAVARPSLHPGFGLMWWNNLQGTLPGVSPRAVWGSGIANLLVSDPERDVVVVLRWYDVPRRDELLRRLFAALDQG